MLDAVVEVLGGRVVGVGGDGGRGAGGGSALTWSCDGWSVRRGGG